MKLAEALVLRSENQNKILNLQSRISNNLTYQEGTELIEDPNELMSMIDTLNAENNELIKKVNHANATAVLDDGTTMLEALVDRETLKREQSIKTKVLAEAHSANSMMTRYSSSEIKTLMAFEVKHTQQRVDDLALELRELENKIQRNNWKISI